MVTIIAGASGGIGSALTRETLARGQGEGTVVALSRHASASETLQALKEEHGDTLRLADADVTDETSLQEALDKVLGRDGKVGRVIYAVGLLHDQNQFPEKKLEEVEADAMVRSFRTNTVGLLLLVKRLLPWLNHSEPKVIAAISAKVGSIGDNQFGGWYAYRCSKAALNMAVANLAVELPRRARPVSCVALHPGTTATPLSAPFKQSLKKLKVHQPEDTAQNLLQIIDGLGENDNGAFYSWDGERLPW